MNRIYVLLFCFLAAACSKEYTLPAYYKLGPKHKVIAIVPPEVKYTGRVPKDVTTAQVEKIEDAESLAFQKDIYDELIRLSGPGKKDIKIDMQALNKTNQILEAQGISLHDSWKKSPEELCKLLGVDAIVRGNLEKERFMSDLASYGIDVAEDILDILMNKIPVALPNPTQGGTDLSRTYHVKGAAQLIDGNEGLTLWGMDRQFDANWDQPVNESVKYLARMFAKRFPYRDK